MENQHIFWAGLATVAGKRFERDLLAVADHELSYRISAKIGSEKLTEVVAGKLSVSPNQSRTTKNKPDLQTLLAAILYRMTPKKRQDLVSMLASEGLIFDTEAEFEAKQLIAALTTSSTSTSRGSLAFTAY